MLSKKYHPDKNPYAAFVFIFITYVYIHYTDLSQRR